MTVLPDGETSVTALLQQAIRAPGNPLRDYDWLALVDEALPGHDTDHQREQAARMARSQADLRAWATEAGLPEDHVEASAIYAVCSTSAEWPWEVTRGLARLIWWGYTFDAFIDQPALREEIKDLATFDHYIDAVIEGLSVHSTFHHKDLPPACIALRAALAHFVADLPTIWGSALGFRKQRYRHHHFLKELAAWIGTMAQESRWDFHLARQQKRQRCHPYTPIYKMAGGRLVCMQLRRSRRIWRVIPAVPGIMRSQASKPGDVWHASPMTSISTRATPPSNMSH